MSESGEYEWFALSRNPISHFHKHIRFRLSHLFSNKVDVWSIGVIFYQMLFGRRPFGDGVSQDNMFLNRTMLDATEVNFPSKPTISDEARSFIQACLTYDQLHRPNISQICAHRYVKLRTDNSFGT